MKPLLCSLLFLFAFSLSAQAPVAVPIPKEPHHHLVLENSYVRVFRVSVPGHDATLLHQHDVPYLYVSLGPADVINAVQGKPEAHLTMADGQIGYSRGVGVPMMVGFMARSIWPITAAECRFIFCSFSLKSNVMRM